MKLKLTLSRESGPEVDLVVTADAATPIADVAAAIQARDPRKAPGARAMSTPTLRLSSRPGRGSVLPAGVELGEAALGSGSRVAIVDIADGQELSVRSSPRVIVSVVAGPDAPSRVELPMGSHILGRDIAAAVRLSDPLVSKDHARIDVSSAAVRLVDLNSANGIMADGEPVTRLDLVDGQVLELGDTSLQIRLVASVDAAELGEGPVVHNRSPRVEERYGGTEFVAPAMPTEQERQPFPWLSMAAPLVMGGVMFAVTRSPLSLMFVALSPILLLGNFLSTRGTRARKFRLDSAKFSVQIEALERSLAEQVERERSIRLKEQPSTSEVVTDALHLGPMLWTRRPEHWSFMSVRLGLCALPSRNSIRVTGEETALPEFLDRVNRVVEQYRLVQGVPVSENLYLAGGLGIAGGQDRTAGVARAILAQLVGLHLSLIHI